MAYEIIDQTYCFRHNELDHAAKDHGKTGNWDNKEVLGICANYIHSLGSI